MTTMCEALPRPVRRTAAIAGLAAWGLAFVVAGFNDRPAAAAAAHEAPSLLALGRFLSLFALSGYMLVLSAAICGSAILVLRRTGRQWIALRARRIAETAAFFFAAIAASGIVCQALKHLVGRARPRFLETLGPYHFAGPTFHSGYEGFPSGHSTTAFAAAVSLSLVRPAWSVVLFPAALVICVSRVVAEAHYPSDTLAGALLGTLVTLRVAHGFARRDIAFPVPDRAAPGVAPLEERDAVAL